MLLGDTFTLMRLGGARLLVTLMLLGGTFTLVLLGGARPNATSSRWQRAYYKVLCRRRAARRYALHLV